MQKNDKNKLKAVMLMLLLILVILLLVLLVIIGVKAGKKEAKYDNLLEGAGSISAWKGDVEYSLSDKEMIDSLNDMLKDAVKESGYQSEIAGGYTLELYNGDTLIASVFTGKKEIVVAKEENYYIVDDSHETIYNDIKSIYLKVVEQKYDNLLEGADNISTWEGNVEYSLSDREIIDSLNNMLETTIEKSVFISELTTGYKLELYNGDTLIARVFTNGKKIVVAKEEAYYIVDDSDNTIYNNIYNIYLKIIEHKYSNLLSDADKIIVNNKGNEYIATDIDLINQLNTVLSDADKMSNYSFKQTREYTLEAYTGDKNICKIYANSVEIVITKDGYYYVIENQNNEIYDKIKEIYQRIINES